MIWQEKRVLLIVLAVLLAANTFFFFTYRVQYENRLTALDTRRDAARAELQAATRARVQADQQLAGYRKIENDIRDIYDVEWSTQRARLTAFIGEVMRQALESHLVPRSYSFTGAPTAKAANKNAPGAKAIEVSIGFPVEGSYSQVRQLLHRLEVSDQFIIVDQVSLGGADNGERLNMTIRVKTFFRDVSAAPGRASNQES